MKSVKIYSKLLLVCVLLMGMGFPNVMPEEENEEEATGGKSIRYVKVGFLACTRPVSASQQKAPLPETDCVEKAKKQPSDEPKTSGAATAPLADNAQIITKHVCWLFGK